MSVEEGGVEVGESAVPGPTESRDESESIVGEDYIAILRKRKQRSKTTEQDICNWKRRREHAHTYSRCTRYMPPPIRDEA